MTLEQYRIRENQYVLAVQINLDTDGFVYSKWGHEQRCKAGDWLINNNEDCYTINQDTFAKTYKEIAPGRFVKTTPVFACILTSAGKVETNEGYTEYAIGDYWVANNPDGSDAYAVSREKFEQMYQKV